MKLHRPSFVIQKQLDESTEILPKEKPSVMDFATELQWASWETHLAELKSELKESLQYESSNQDAIDHGTTI